MNTELMGRVREVIATNPARHKQGHYIGLGFTSGDAPAVQVTLGELRTYALQPVPGEPLNPDRPLCGTTACIAGWTIILAGDPQFELKIILFDLAENLCHAVRPGDVDCCQDWMWNRARDLLGLTESQASWLFAARRTHAQVVGALAWLPLHQDADCVDLATAFRDHAPEIDGPPGFAPSRWPIFRWDNERQPVMPSDDEMLALARSIVTAVRTASGPAEAAILSKACGCEWTLTERCARHAPGGADPYEDM